MQQQIGTQLSSEGRRFIHSAHRMKTLRAKSCTQIVSTPPPGATLPRCPPATDTASNHRLFLGVCKTRLSGQPLREGEIVGPATQEATEDSLQSPDLPIGQVFRSRRDRHSTTQKSWAVDSHQQQELSLASQPFRCDIRIQHHLEYANGPRLPCREHRPNTRMFHHANARLLLRPHSQTSAFETPIRPGRAPETTPATEVLPTLVMHFAS